MRRSNSDQGPIQGGNLKCSCGQCPVDDEHCIAFQPGEPGARGLKAAHKDPPRGGDAYLEHTAGHRLPCSAHRDGLPAQHSNSVHASAGSICKP
jgi:hypothetical protein